MKRPLCAMAVAWILGEFFAEHRNLFVSVLFFLLFCGLVLVKKNKKEVVFWLEMSVVVFCVGKQHMADLLLQYARCDSFEEGAVIRVAGSVQEITEKTYGTVILLKVEDIFSDLQEEQRKWSVMVQVQTKTSETLRIGNSVYVSGTKKAFHSSRNPGNFDEKEYCRGKKIAMKLEAESVTVQGSNYSKIRQYLSEGKQKWMENIHQSCGEEEAAILQGIIFGDKSGMDRGVKDLYTRNGIAHILVVSGLHMSIVGMGIYQWLRKRYSFFPSGVLSAIILLAFGTMTGFSVSVIRALSMLLLRIAADITGRTYDFKTAVAFSLFLVLYDNPYALYSASFLLSYSAMISIGFVSPEFMACFGRNKPKKMVRFFEPLISGTIMWLVNLPVISWFYFEVSTYSIFLNLVILPFMSMIFLSGILAAILPLFSETAGIFAAGPAVFLVKVDTFLCECVEKLPKASIVTGRMKEEDVLLFYALLFVLILFLRKFEQKKQVMTAVVFLLQIYLVYHKELPSGLEISMIDVGQGDCILVQNDTGTTYLMDGGSTSVTQPARYHIVPYLKYQGIGTVDYVFISHGDEDHINGIEEILTENLLRIRTLILPETLEFQESYQPLLQLAKKAGTEVVWLKAGANLTDENLTFDLVSPCEKSYADINDASMVMKMSYFDFSMYFTGDISQTTEMELLEILEKADVLKVPHHGSKSSSSEAFIEKINPAYAMISSGVKNQYGHPHEETIQRYKAQGTTLLQTTEYGCIRIEITKPSMRSSARKKFLILHYI